MLKKLPLLLLMLILFMTGSALGGCSAQTSTDHALTMAPMEQMPSEVQSASVTVQQAYQFAVANPDVLQHLPCYCGCGKTPALGPAARAGASVGHTSNYACYVSGVDANGAVTFDTHALGCSICVDITQDAMRLLKQGKSVPEIKNYVDTAYAKYGPSNMP